MALAEDDIAQVIRESGRPGALDVALCRSPTTPGRLTFAWGPDGDLVWDDSGAYAVLLSLLAHRGAYRWDRTFGTLLYRVTRERATTGSQLASYARDGGAQVEQEGLVTDVAARATRLASGRWTLRITWRAAGRPQVQEIGL